MECMFPKKPDLNDYCTWTEGCDLKLLLFLFHTEEFGWLGQSEGIVKGGERSLLYTCKHLPLPPVHCPTQFTCPSHLPNTIVPNMRCQLSEQPDVSTVLRAGPHLQTLLSKPNRNFQLIYKLSVPHI